MAILSRFQDEEVILVDDLSLPEIRTKQVVEIFGALELTGASCLIGTDEYDLKLYKSARNIPGVEVMPVDQWNAYQILRPKKLLITKKGLDALLTRKSETTEDE